jgi:hypothetical protein
MAWPLLLRAPLADLLVRDPVPSFARAAAERILPALLACALAVALFVVFSGIARAVLRGLPPVISDPEPDGLPADLAVGAGAGLLAVAAAAYVGLSLSGW